MLKCFSRAEEFVASKSQDRYIWGWASLHYQSVSLQPRKTQQTRFCTCSPFTHAMGCRAIGAMI
ncbi:hypothetical protein CH063_04338 [Colletotrichum higginsianum]|uniref:Uncharacterized protein n=1 Tax=Colletotrichum higginsianum (strain IMI 349063) TaxID=759273 RepID=H1UUY3_COLHI|nr:hypothetical protein CH063_04338 [Colletotrichum higginsianum]